MTDLSNTDGYVTKDQFVNMANRVSTYLAINGEKPNKVYTTPKQVDHVSWAVYEDMFERWAAYHENKGVWPNKVYFQKSAVPNSPVNTDSPAIRLLKSKSGDNWDVIRTAFNAVGEFSSFYEFYNKCKGRGYSYYNNDVYNRQDAFGRLSTKQGLNCSDASQLGYAVAKAIGGYSVQYVHIQCRSGGGHIVLRIKGNEFKDWTWVDMAACLSVNSQYKIGNRWCPDGTVLSYDDGWLISDDGIT